MNEHSKIYEDEKSIVHIGNNEIFGFIITDEFCPDCSSEKVYYHDYDAKFCPNCNKWLEKRCNDETCDYCSIRPEKPLV